MAGIENTGFVKKSFDEIKTEMENTLRQNIGQDLNLESTSIIGNLISIASKQANDLWELGSSVYNSRFIQTANGNSVDRIVSLLNIDRFQDQFGFGTAYLYGLVNTIVPIGTSFLTSTGEIYETQEQVTLNVGQAPILTFNRRTGVTTNNFVISQVGNVFGLFSSANGSETFNLEYSANVSSLENAFGVFFGSENIASVTKDATGKITLNFSTNIFVPNFTSTGLDIEIERAGLRDGAATIVQSINPGAIVTGAGQLNTVQTPVSGLTGVINFATFERGRLRETDLELRQRWFDRIGSSVSSTPQSIRRELLKIPGVLQAIVFEDQPGTAEIVIFGGDPEDIAQSLFDNKIIGIEFTGSTTENAKDAQGLTYPLRFSRPEVLNFEVRIDINRLPDFPLEGVEEIKTLLTTFSNTFRIGSALRPSPDMIWALRTVAGLNSLDIQIKKENEADFSKDSVQLGNRERPEFTSIRVYENGVEL